MIRLSDLRNGTWLDRQTFPALSFAVPGLVPEGFGLFTGASKVGKSFLVLDSALAVASGGVALGSIRTGDPRPVLLLALEDGDRRLQHRCRLLLGAESPIPALLEFTTRATPLEVLETIDAWLDAHGHDRPLVVLDTLGRVMPPALPGESAYGRDYRVGSRLKALTDNHPGSCLQVVHHIRKQAGEDWMDSTSGTNGLNGSADWTLNLSRPRNENNGILRVTGRDIVEGEYAVSCDSGSWQLTGGALSVAARAAEQYRATADLGDRSVEIITYVNATPNGVSPKQVAEALGMPDARRYLARLVETGRLEKAGRGLYTPVPTVPMSQLDELDWDNGTDETGGTGGSSYE